MCCYWAGTCISLHIIHLLSIQDIGCASRYVARCSKGPPSHWLHHCTTATAAAVQYSHGLWLHVATAAAVHLQSLAAVRSRISNDNEQLKHYSQPCFDVLYQIVAACNARCAQELSEWQQA
jgi:hypothetical protein